MVDWWIENAAKRGTHTLVDLGYVRSARARQRADALLEHVGKYNLQLAGSGRLLMHLPKTKVTAILKAFPRIKPREDGKPGYCWCTHTWLCKESTDLKHAQ